MPLKPAKQLEIAKSACDWEPKNRKLRIDYRKLCINLGQPALAGFEYGDQVVVRVDPDAYWTHEWRGKVIEVQEGKDVTFLKVIPVNNMIQLKPGAEIDWVLAGVRVVGTQVELVEAATP